MRRIVIALSVVVAAACATAPDTKAEATSASCPKDDAAPAAAEAPHHPHFAEGSKIAQFHDVLAPLWHAAPGAQRTTDTCAATAKMHEIARTMATDVPADAAMGYGEKAAALDASLTALDGTCAAADHAGFDAAFHAVHEAFHAIAESAAH